MSTDSEEMENLNRSITGIATVYELQLRNISKHHRHHAPAARARRTNRRHGLFGHEIAFRVHDVFALSLP